MRATLLLSAALTLCAAASSCGSRAKLLEYRRVDPGVMSEDKTFSVLRAPAGGDTSPEEIPVVFFLHGMGDDPRSLDRFGLSEPLLEKMRAGVLPRAHIVMPQGDRGFWWNWYDGSRRYEDHVMDEVIPAAEELLGVTPDPSRRHLMGVSMGGSGAIHMGLRHPSSFASVSVFSGMIMNQEIAQRFMNESFLRHFVDFEQIFGGFSDPAYNLANDPYLITEARAPNLGQRLFIAAGDDEEEAIMDTTLLFHEHLERLEVEHRYVVYEGGHGWRYWEPVIHEALDYALR